LYISLIIENTTGTPHLKIVGWCFVIERSRIRSPFIWICERNTYS